MVLRNERWRRIVRDAAQVALGDDLSIRLSRGELGATVRTRRPQTGCLKTRDMEGGVQSE